MFSHYPSDPRPRREAEALMRQGAAVEVICLQNSEAEPCEETFNNVQITRVRLKKRPQIVLACGPGSHHAGE